MLLVAHLSYSYGEHKLCNPIVGIDASQLYHYWMCHPSHLYHYSMCHPMPSGLYSHWDLDSETSRFRLWQNKTRCFENMVLPCFQRKRPECKIVSFCTTGRENQTECFIFDDISFHWNTVFEAIGCFRPFYPCHEVHLSLSLYLTGKDIKRSSTKEELDDLRWSYIKKTWFQLKCRRWLLETVKDNRYCQKTYPRKLSSKTFIRSGATIATNDK